MKKSSKELLMLLILVGDLYKRLENEIPEGVNWIEVLNLASRNSVLFYIITKILKSDIVETMDKNLIKHMKNLRKLGDEHLLLLGKTLKELNFALGIEKYLLIKTYRGYPCITHDVDILVNDIRDSAISLKEHDFSIKEGEKYKASAYKKDFLPIGLHERVSWGSITVLDEDLLWQNPRREKVQGLDTLLPNIEGDLLIYLAHITFEEYRVTLRDLLSIYRLSREVDWNTILWQSRKHGWNHSMRITIAIVNSLHRQLYSEPSLIEKRIPASVNVKPKLPYEYPLHYLMKIFSEKKALKHLIWDLPVYAYKRLDLRFSQHATYTQLDPPRFRILRPIEAFWREYFGRKYLQ